MIQSAGMDLFDPTAGDDFLEQILSSVPSTPWPDLSTPIPYSYRRPLLLNQSINFNDSPPPAKPPLPINVGQRELLRPTTALSNAFADAGLPPLNNGVVGGGGKGKQRVRARRGQATDPHSIAERLRRERIAERMKALQELVPNANKTDKASMLDEIIEYVKFLQLQVKVLSMSRLGGAAASISPQPSHNPTIKSKLQGTKEGETDIEEAEKHVAKLLEEDMGTAMQYLQGKGLCLMPISIATSISSTASNTPLLPSPSILTHVVGASLDITNTTTTIPR